MSNIVEIEMKKKIALLTGGFTGESDVSFRSSKFVYSQIDSSLYDVFEIVISPEKWFYRVGEQEVAVVDKNDFTITLNGEKIKFDLVFVMVHGTPGEDGRIQGYLDMLNIPYTSCSASTSSLTMNKAYTKAVLEGIENLHVAQSVLIFPSQKEKAIKNIKENLRLPLFIKPNTGGSSIGMSKVNVWDELEAAIEKAFNTEGTDAQVLVEEFVTGREFSVGIFKRLDGSLAVLPSTEVIASREFFDFEAKYTPGLTQEITPADQTPEQIEKVQNIIKEIYTKLNCSGMVRVDYFLEKETDKFYFIEINTIPGQTAQSFIPQQVRAFGMTEQEFYGEIIEVALQGE